MIDAPAVGLSFLPLKFSRNKLTHTIEAADPALESRAGLKYYLTLKVPEYTFSSNLVELHTSEGREIPVDSESGLSVYAGAEFRYNAGRNGKIDGLLSYTKPRFHQLFLSLSLTQTIAFSFTEHVTGGEPTVDTTKEISRMMAIKAGLSNEDYYAHAETFWNVYQAAARQFLTWQPNYKRVNRNQEEYLYFLLNFTPSPQTLQLRVQYYFENGENEGEATAFSIANPALYSVLCCPAGAEALNVPADAVRYDVWLSNEDNRRISEVRSYFIDARYEAFDRSVLFVNSLGGWDTLRLTGEAQRTLKVGQTVAEIERPAAAGIDFSELKVISVEGEHEIQISTGYFRRDAANYLNYLDELLLSEEIYLISDKGHRPLQLITSNLTDQQDNTDLIARTFNFRILDTVENYSNLPATDPVPEKPTTWRGLNLKHVLDGYGKRTGQLVFERLEKVYASDNSLVSPYTVKPNVQGDPDYIAPIGNAGITPGSTPFPNALIERAGSFNRATCGAGYLGGPPTITIPAGKYGGEVAGLADSMAEAEYARLNTQEYANSNGTCVINNIPVHFAILHKIPMDGSLKVAGSADYGPVVDLRIAGATVVTNTVGESTPLTQLSGSTYAPGTYNLLCEVEYAGAPRRACLLKIPSKNRQITATDNGFFLFENVVVSSSDEPLTIEVVNL